MDDGVVSRLYRAGVQVGYRNRDRQSNIRAIPGRRRIDEIGAARKMDPVATEGQVGHSLSLHIIVHRSCGVDRVTGGYHVGALADRTSNESVERELAQRRVE